MSSVTSESIPMCQWRIANAYQTLLQVEVARTAGWMKSPTEYKEPSLISLHAHWVRIKDILAKLTVSPVAIPVDKEEELRKQRVYALDYIHTQNNKINGMMQAMEEHNPSLYQSTLSKQVFDRLALFREQLTEADLMDEYELDELYELRDLLEYASYAVEIIRLDYPRLKDIDFDKFQRELEEVDQTFREAVGRKTIPIPYSPETFWWRKYRR